MSFIMLADEKYNIQMYRKEQSNNTIYLLFGKNYNDTRTHKMIMLSIANAVAKAIKHYKIADIANNQFTVHYIDESHKDVGVIDIEQLTGHTDNFNIYVNQALRGELNEYDGTIHLHTPDNKHELKLS